MAAMTKISVNEFKKQLRLEVEEIAKEQGWKIDNNAERGYAFQLWVASVFCSYDKGFLPGQNTLRIKA